MDTNESDRALAKKVWLGIIHGEAHLDADTVVNEAAETITANLAAERADNAQELLETATKMAEYETAMMHYQEESARLTTENMTVWGVFTNFHAYVRGENPSLIQGNEDREIVDAEALILAREPNSVYAKGQIADSLRTTITRLTAETERLLGLLTRSLSYHEHGIPERPNHQCGTPDAVCDCECCNYADYEAFIVDARAALAGDAHKEADHD